MNNTSGIWNSRSGYTWVAVRCLGGQCLASNDWNTGTPACGYAVYRTADWTASGLTSGSNLINAATQPILFFPAGGGRNPAYGNIASFVYDAANPQYGVTGYYWSSTVGGDYRSAQTWMNSTGISLGASTTTRATGESIRCVKE